MFNILHMPKGLMARALTILFVPLFLIQVVTGYIFFDRHTETILRVLSNTIAGDIALVCEWVDRGYDINRIQSLATRHLQLDVHLKTGEKLQQKGAYRRTWLYEFMDDALEKNLNSPYFVRMTNDMIHIAVECRVGLLDIQTERKRLFSRTTPLVAIWTVASSLILFVIAGLFMRNQVRPIVRLARVAKAFGQGQDLPFKPEGASEVRQAGTAFLDMRERLNFQLTERMNMLAGVSHDLRTVLTRMKLQIALMKSKEVELLSADVQTMQDMVEEFLHYTRYLHHEDFILINIVDVIQKIQEELRDFPVIYNGFEEFWAYVRPTLIYRSLTNIILNCKRHATKAQISLIERQGEWEVIIDDNGPGISLAEREKACQAFYRLDAARNLDQGGVGLGLTIARDGILAHGGNLWLDNAPLGGLRVRMVMPRLQEEKES